MPVVTQLSVSARDKIEKTGDKAEASDMTKDPATYIFEALQGAR